MIKLEPLISVILTSYNKPLFVGKAIESMLAQTETNWELFIMDDNSNSETVKVIKRYIEDPRIYYFNSNIEHKERYKTTRYATIINDALKMVKGKFISYLTDDTTFLPERLELMSQYFYQHPECNILYSSQLVKQVNIEFREIRRFIRQAKQPLKHAAFTVDHCSVMHRSELIHEIHSKYGNYWDDNPDHWNHGDAAFWKRLNEKNIFFPINKILDITYKTPDSFQTLFNSLPSNIIEGTIVKGSSEDIYYIQNYSRKKITEEIFALFKFSRFHIVHLPDPILYKIPESEPLGLEILPNFIVVYAHDMNSYFYLESGQKRLIVDWSTMKQLKFNFKNVVKLDGKLLSSLDDGPLLTTMNQKNFIPPGRKLFRTPSKLWICFDGIMSEIDPRVAKRFHLEKDSISISSAFLQKYKKGNPIIPLSSYTSFNII